MFARPLNQKKASSVEPFEFVQSPPAATWTITHNLNRRVQVRLIDAAGQQMSAETVDIDLNTIEVRFGAPESGRATVI